jgi:hypothetical protein
LSVYKCSLLINTELNSFVQHQIDRTDDKFIQWEVRRLLLLGLRAKSVSSRRDGSTILFTNNLFKYLKNLYIKITVHTLTCLGSLRYIHYTLEPLLLGSVLEYLSTLVYFWTIPRCVQGWARRCAKTVGASERNQYYRHWWVHRVYTVHTHEQSPQTVSALISSLSTHKVVLARARTYAHASNIHSDMMALTSHRQAELLSTL